MHLRLWFDVTLNIWSISDQSLMNSEEMTGPNRMQSVSCWAGTCIHNYAYTRTQENTRKCPQNFTTLGCWSLPRNSKEAADATELRRWILVLCVSLCAWLSFLQNTRSTSSVRLQTTWTCTSRSSGFTTSMLWTCPPSQTLCLSTLRKTHTHTHISRI